MSLLLKVVKSELLISLLIAVADVLAKRTDNQIDDKVVALLKDVTKKG